MFGGHLVKWWLISENYTHRTDSFRISNERYFYALQYRSSIDVLKNGSKKYKKEQFGGHVGFGLPVQNRKCSQVARGGFLYP